jgi:hypothetical protein
MVGFLRVLLLVAVVFAGASHNPLSWLLSLGAAGIWLGWYLKPREHPVLLMALLVPFVEIVTSLVNVELGGLTLNEGFGNGGEQAYLLSILTFILFMLGLRWAAGRTGSFPVTKSIEQGLKDLPMRRLVVGHLLFHGLAIVSQSVFGHGSTFFQLTLHFSKFPLIFLYLILWKYQLQGENRGLVWGIFLANLALRLGGFFSDWKELLFLLLYVGLLVTKEFDGRWLRRMSVLGAVGLVFLFTWQAVKVNYRDFLNGGTRSQRVVVGFGDALSKFTELTGEYWLGTVEENTQDIVLQSTLDRLGYLEFFAITVERVPHSIPFQEGGLMQDNLEFALIPRFLNPNKGVKNDQWKVERFAGVDIADNASFSLGRYAEWYVDYGRGMLLCGLLFGAVGGWLIWVIHRRATSLAASWLDPIFLMLALQNFCSYQSDEIVVYGQTFWAMVVYIGIGRPLMLRLLKNLPTS